MEPLKNLFDENLIEQLSDSILKHYPKFDKQQFSKDIFFDGWENLELKERMRHTVICLNNNLGLNFKDSLKILKKIAPSFNNFTAMVFPDFVEVYGLNNYSESIKTLEYFTQYSSSEFAIRQFILKYPERTMEQMLSWSKHKNYHVRRLSSEGCRPRLPWSVALPDFKKDPSLILPILTNLINDESEYVRKSAANNLNDISKDNSQITLDFTKKWIGKSKNIDWILKHGNRTLLKKGNHESLKLFGTSNNVKVELIDFSIHNEQIKIGETNTFSFDIKLKESKPQKVRLEYEIDFVKSSGKTSKKIFKISESKLKSNEKKTVTKKHNFKDYSTRKHFPGKHKISIIINGKKYAEGSFSLVKN